MSSEETETKEVEETTPDQQLDGEEESDGSEEERQQISMEELAEMLLSAAKEDEKSEPSLENMRSLGLYGDVDEERISEVIAGLLTLHHLGKPKLTDEGEVKEEGKPIDMYISTYGGSADDMASLVDIMNVVKKDCPIRTIGIGKVMSAGVLLLAAGTKGKRKIGKYCRVMIHSVVGGSHGSLPNLANEMEAMQQIQKDYIDALVAETSMSKKDLKKLLERKVNVYLSAEEAVELGIADIII